MAQKTQLNHVLWVYLLFCWAGIAYAADLSFAEGIESVPLKALGYVAVLSILGGMAATLPKIINPAVVINNVWGEILKDVVFSLLAGIILFLIAVWWEWPWPQTCLAIILGGAGNAKFIDMVLNNGFFPRVAQALGKGQNNELGAAYAGHPTPQQNPRRRKDSGDSGGYTPASYDNDSGSHSASDGGSDGGGDGGGGD